MLPTSVPAAIVPLDTELYESTANPPSASCRLEVGSVTSICHEDGSACAAAQRLAWSRVGPPAWRSAAWQPPPSSGVAAG